MRLQKQEREFFRKLFEKLIVKNPHFKQCQVVDHLVWEGIAWQTAYNDLYICKKKLNGKLKVCDTLFGPPSLAKNFNWNTWEYF